MQTGGAAIDLNVPAARSCERPERAHRLELDFAVTNRPKEP